jgi:hypothetical protein
LGNLESRQLPKERDVISTSSVVVAAQDQVSSDLGEEVVILHLKNGVYYGLDEVGARIWNLIQEPKAVNEIRDVLLDEYEVEPESCERDLLALLEELAVENLVKVRDGTDS